MMRAWQSVAAVVVCLSILGCESGSRDSLIRDTNNQVDAVATSLNSIKASLDEFIKKKETDKDEDGAKKSLQTAVEEANKLKQIAEEMQKLASRVNSLAPLTEDEKKANLERNRKTIDQNREGVIKAHQDMKLVLVEANKKYSESLNELTKSFSEAESKFAAIVRKR